MFIFDEGAEVTLPCSYRNTCLHMQRSVCLRCLYIGQRNLFFYPIFRSAYLHIAFFSPSQFIFIGSDPLNPQVYLLDSLSSVGLEIISHKLSMYLRALGHPQRPRQAQPWGAQQVPVMFIKMNI